MVTPKNKDNMRGPYRSSNTELCVQYFLFQTIYEPRFWRRSSEKVRLSMKTSNKISENVLEDLVFENYYSHLGMVDGISHSDISKWYHHDTTFKGLIAELESNKGQFSSIGLTTMLEEYSPPLSYPSINKMISRMSKEKNSVLVLADSIDRVNNIKYVFPKETKDAFTKLINNLSVKATRDSSQRYAPLFSTEYFKIMLNRNFVLEILKNITPYVWVKDPYRENEELVCPIVGSYHKNKDDFKSLDQFINFIEIIRDTCLSKNSFSTQELYELCKMDATNSDITSMFLDEKSSKNLIHLCDLMIRDIKSVYEGARAYLRYEKDSENRIIESSPIYKFDLDPEGILREESPYYSIDIDNEDIIEKDKKKYLKGTAEIHKIRGKNILNLTSESERKGNDLISMYSETLDSVVTAILALIQFSPNALFFFVCHLNEWVKNHYESHGESRILEFKNILSKIVSLALKDFMNDNYVNQTVNYIEDGDGVVLKNLQFPIKFQGVGNCSVDGNQSIFQFKISENKILTFTWSKYYGDKVIVESGFRIKGDKRYSGLLLNILNMSPCCF